MYIVVKSADGIVPSVNKFNNKPEAFRFAWDKANKAANEPDDEPAGTVWVEPEFECKQYSEKYIYRTTVKREGLKKVSWYVYEV